MIAAAGPPVEVAARVLATSTAGYYAWLSRHPSAKAVRHALLTDVIAAVHATSKGIYGAHKCRLPGAVDTATGWLARLGTAHE